MRRNLRRLGKGLMLLFFIFCAYKLFEVWLGSYSRTDGTNLGTKFSRKSKRPQWRFIRKPSGKKGQGVQKVNKSNSRRMNIWKANLTEGAKKEEVHTTDDLFALGKSLNFATRPTQQPEIPDNGDIERYAQQGEKLPTVGSEKSFRWKRPTREPGMSEDKLNQMKRMKYGNLKAIDYATERTQSRKAFPTESTLGERKAGSKDVLKVPSFAKPVSKWWIKTGERMKLNKVPVDDPDRKESAKITDNNPSVQTRKSTVDFLTEAKLFLRKMSESHMDYNTGIYYRTGKKNESIFYREVTPAKDMVRHGTIFLLHSRRHTSALWLRIGTLYELARVGFRVIAVDLPKYGRSKDTAEVDPALARAQLLAGMMRALEHNAPRFLVSPGMSGIYSVPLVMTTPSLLKGVVFIAPTFTSKYSVSRYENLELPTLVFYGQNDTTMLPYSSLDSLEHLRNKRIYMLPDASQDCYVEQPDIFHRVLTRFLLNPSEVVKPIIHTTTQQPKLLVDTTRQQNITVQ